jgi:hypothetical protein
MVTAAPSRLAEMAAVIPAAPLPITKTWFFLFIKHPSMPAVLFLFYHINPVSLTWLIFFTRKLLAPYYTKV